MYFFIFSVNWMNYYFFKWKSCKELALNKNRKKNEKQMLFSETMCQFVKDENTNHT